MRRFTVLLAAMTLLSACPATPDNPARDAGPDATDGGPDAPPGLEVTSVLPRRGPVEGGTRVTVSGSGFAEGATVAFGEAEASAVEVASATEISCETPPAAAPGAVDVRVTAEGATATLAGGFTYEAAPPAGIDRCRLEGPASLEVEAGGVSDLVTGLVLAEGATEAAGQAPGIAGELGFGPDGSDPSGGDAGWTWVGLRYQGDSGDEDRHEAALIVSTVGEHDYAVRFTADGGASWTYCDLDGSDVDGYSPDQAGALTVVESETPQVDWCRLERPASTSATAGAETEPVFGQVFEPGLTDAAGVGRGVRAQAGLGPDGASPAGSDWTWRDAAYDGDIGDNDEYRASLEAPAPGSYDYAYRFSLDGGASWVYCDLDGTDDGYAPDDAGSLAVEVPGDPEVDWCVLQWPESATAEPGAASPTIYGRVYEAGVTDAPGPGSGLAAQLGFGPDGVSPDGSTDWAWVDATYNMDYGANDEYEATLTVADEGTYDYAYRFSLDGAHWLYCDLGGSSDGYSAAEAGSLVVAPAGPELVDWCGLWWPPSTSTLDGVPTEAIYGQVYEPGLTDAVGMGAGVTAQLGFGPDGVSPDGSADWSWVDAVYNVDNWDNDEYMAALVVPTPGAYDYAYRFSLDGGASWLYCDDDSSDGYDPADAGELTVTAAERVDWCAIQWPATLTVTTDTDSDPVYGRVFEPGVTEAAGAGVGVTAEVGYGPDGTDPATTASWTWSGATYNVDDGPNDEYQGTLHPTASGSYDYAYRFSLDGGASWLYCDLDGSSDGYDPADGGELTVVD